MPVSLIDAIMGTHVDLGGLEDGLKKAEKMAEDAAKKIADSVGIVGLGAITAIAGTVVFALEKAISKTAEWGLEMEHLGNRMGMTATEAATLVGIFERFGISSGVAARSMQMMAQQVRQTQEAIDPFQTKMGKLLGTLKDNSGANLNLGQVLDLVRQKISSAATDTEKLQIAQSLLGTRIGGQVVGALKLNNAEWDKFKASVQAAQGPVEEAAEKALAYKEATAELEQQFRGLQVTIGSQLLPAFTEFIKSLSTWLEKNKAFIVGLTSALTDLVHPIKFVKSLLDELIVNAGLVDEKLGLLKKGSSEAYAIQSGLKKGAEEHASAEEKAKKEIQGQIDAAEETEKRQQQVAALVKEQVGFAEKLRALGLGNEKDVQAQVETALVRLKEQQALLEAEHQKLGDSPALADARLKIETDINKNRIEAAELVGKAALDQYKNEELQIKANGAASLSSEINLLQKKLADERIVGDERLKLEGEIFQKRKQYTEEAIQIGRQLGFVSAQQEIDYRKQQAAQKLGQGDALGAAQEVVKARDLAIKQADQVLEFTKKIRTVSLQSEIEYQKQKLELVRGNAEQEMQIIGQIADLDKQLYDKRLQAALTYTQNAINAYRELQKATGQDTSAVSGAKESLTFAQAGNEAERARFQQARTLEQVAQHGGTEEARSTAVKQSQDILKQVEEAQQLGKSVSEGMKEAADAARDLLKAASGGEEVRAPGGPNPVAASLSSSSEAMSTAGLNRGSDIPRLDTSFTDLAVRVRDVLLGTVPNIQNFSNALAAGIAKISAATGFQPNPGAVGPGGSFTNLPTQGSTTLQTSSSTPAPPTVGPGSTQPAQPSTVVGVGGFAQSDLASKIDDLVASLDGFADKVTSSLQDNASANAQSLQDTLTAIQQNRAPGTEVTVSVDPDSGDLIVGSIVKQLQ